jgi:hypothetical protein
MSFWDTVAGYEFVSHTVPALVKELETLNQKKEQYTMLVSKSSIAATIGEELLKGARVVALTEVNDGRVLVVFE